MLKKITLALCVLTTWQLKAQTNFDKQCLKQLEGCFSVTFNYAETFTNDTSVKRCAHPMDNQTVVEMVYPLESSGKKVVLQHILVVGKNTVIKHWREDWEYEPATMWVYESNKKWIKKNLPADAVKGKWLQTVWEVDDAPRYQGLGKWIENNGQAYWLNTTDAPLPRREYTTRKDYNVMQRTNKIIVSGNGWLHEQDNKKIIRKTGVADSLLAEEKGYNNYVRIANDLCNNATDFWTKEKDVFWKNVREVWQSIMDNANVIELKTKVNDKFLYEALDEVENKRLTGREQKTAIATTIKLYVK